MKKIKVKIKERKETSMHNNYENLTSKRGNIVVGYPGIGKSTAARLSNKFIDLESSLFHNQDDSSDKWCATYCQVAANLASQGHIVFVSSHAAVRAYLKSMDLPKYVSIVGCVPDKGLADEWKKRLFNRWLVSESAKDKAAYDRALNHFEEDIDAIKADIDFVFVLRNMKYDLLQIVNVLDPDMNDILD